MNRLLTYLLALTIFLIKMPPLYFLPITQFKILFMNHNIARLLIIIVFLIIVIRKINKSTTYYTNHKLLFWLIGFYLFSQSLSIINTINVKSFLIVYKDLFISLMLFYNAFAIINKKNVNTIIKFLICATIINITIQISLYFSKPWFNNYLKIFFNEKYWLIFNYQTNRGRFFGELLDESILPYIFLMIYKKPQKKLNTLILNLVFFEILLITFVSNWRTKFIIFIFSYLGSYILYSKKIKKIFLIQMLFIPFILTLSIFVSSKLVGYNLFDRLNINSYAEEKILSSRVKYVTEGINIGLKNPLLGVGLGNFYDYLPFKSQLENQAPIILKPPFTLGIYLGGYKFTLIDDPHNIFVSTFAASGLFGLISLNFLLIYFINNDLKKLLTKNKIVVKASIITFWSIFFYSLLNPYMYFSYLSFLFTIRGIVEKLSRIYK